MKFSFKVFLAAVITVACCFSLCGYLLVNAIFHAALDTAGAAALEKNRVMGFSLTTAAANIPVSYEMLPDEIVVDIAEAMEESWLSGAEHVELLAADGETLYAEGRDRFDQADAVLPALPERGEMTYTMAALEEGYGICVASAVEVQGRTLVLRTQGDITSAFRQREEAYRTFRLLMILVTGLVSLLMLTISWWMTRPMRDLVRMSRRLKNGEMSVRTRVRGRDEMAELGTAFNEMAEGMEAHIRQLENENRAREDFIASFAHELKTPLTSIIGYADMLRSRALSQKDSFTAANYIFSEGRRLESLSLKLMDIIVLHRTEPEMRRVNGRVFLREVVGVMQPIYVQSGIRLKLYAENAAVIIEPDLMKTLVINLLDNARKASEPGSDVELYGRLDGAFYDIIVRDHGRGIPESELSKITEAFYMVDKSRSRAQNGAGLGLAICAEIAEIHGSALEFDSTPDVGTAVRLRLKGGQRL